MKKLEGSIGKDRKRQDHGDSQESISYRERNEGGDDEETDTDK